MREIRGWAEDVLKWVRERKTPSAMVERQMLPRQTKRTETFFGGEESVIVVVLGVLLGGGLVRRMKAGGVLSAKLESDLGTGRV
jgi:hypothetical protein